MAPATGNMPCGSSATCRMVKSITDLDRLYAMYEAGDKNVFAVFSKERAPRGAQGCGADLGFAGAALRHDEGGVTAIQLPLDSLRYSQLGVVEGVARLLLDVVVDGQYLLRQRLSGRVEQGDELIPDLPEFQDYVLDELTARKILRRMKVFALHEKLDAWLLELLPERRHGTYAAGRTWACFSDEKYSRSE